MPGALASVTRLMTAPAIEAKPYEEALFDHSKPLARELVDAIIADLQHDLDDLNLSAEAAIKCHVLWGQALFRLDDLEGALAQFQQACSLNPMRLVPLRYAGVALLGLGRTAEGVDLLAHVASHAPRDSNCLGNLALGYAVLGKNDESIEAINKAMQAADPRNQKHSFILALQAACLGLNAEAVEYFVRFLALRDGFDPGERSAVDILIERRGTYEESLTENGPLRDAIALALAFDEEMKAPVEERAENPEGVLAMFEATRSMRERATAAVLAGETSLS